MVEMKNKADIVIIGGGIIGCAVAFNLAKKGMKDIVVLEKGFLASGATGRCGAGVRQQWGTRQNCLLAKESMTILENISDYLEEKVTSYRAFRRPFRRPFHRAYRRPCRHLHLFQVFQRSWLRWSA